MLYYTFSFHSISCCFFLFYVKGICQFLFVSFSLVCLFSFRSFFSAQILFVSCQMYIRMLLLRLGNKNLQLSAAFRGKINFIRIENSLLYRSPILFELAFFLFVFLFSCSFVCSFSFLVALHFRLLSRHHNFSSSHWILYGIRILAFRIHPTCRANNYLKFCFLFR